MDHECDFCSACKRDLDDREERVMGATTVEARIVFFSVCMDCAIADRISDAVLQTQKRAS